MKKVKKQKVTHGQDFEKEVMKEQTEGKHKGNIPPGPDEQN